LKLLFQDRNANGGSPTLRRLTCALAGIFLILSASGAVSAEAVRSTPPATSPTPSGSVTLFSEDFDDGPGSFDFVDDPFRGTDSGAYSFGHWLTIGGDGSLLVKLGSRDNADIDGMSGGWKIEGVLPAPTQMTLRFRYALYQTPHYESDEFSQMLVRVGNTYYGTPPNDYVAQVAGDGNGGGWVGTGWRTFEVDLGVLPAGYYSTVIGAYNNRKTFYNESTLRTTTAFRTLTTTAPTIRIPTRMTRTGTGQATPATIVRTTRTMMTTATAGVRTTITAPTTRTPARKTRTGTIWETPATTVRTTRTTTSTTTAGVPTRTTARRSTTRLRTTSAPGWFTSRSWIRTSGTARRTSRSTGSSRRPASASGAG